MCNPTHRKPHRLDGSPVDRHSGGRGDECKLIRLAITNLEIMRGARLCTCRNFNADDQVTALEYVILLGSVTRQPMKLGKGNHAIAAQASYVHGCIQRCQRYRKV
jgi:hypothetical protein